MAAAASPPRRIVLGITGGIAAYKAVHVARELVLAGHDVQIIATPSALRFVGKPTLEAISRHPVHTELYEGVAEVRHVAIGQSADLIIVAPATAHTIARLAAGLADDLLTNSILASTAPLVLAPAMHTEMWQHPATVANVARLRERGAVIIGPESGQLTGTDSGPGRMSEPADIVRVALAALAPQDLAGCRVVVSAGGTQEAIDPVRYVGNRSSGRQGVEIAAAARDRGADVVLVAAHLDVAVPGGLRRVDAPSAEELRAAMVAEAADADVVIMAAAVADYRPATTAEAKLKKSDQGEELILRMVQNPDILRELVDRRRPGQTIVGFAAETETDPERLLEVARAKAARKGADVLVVNRVGWTSGFGASADNEVTMLDVVGNVLGAAQGTKSEVAGKVLDVIHDLRKRI